MNRQEPFFMQHFTLIQAIIILFTTIIVMTYESILIVKIWVVLFYLLLVWFIYSGERIRKMWRNFAEDLVERTGKLTDSNIKLLKENSKLKSERGTKKK